MKQLLFLLSLTVFFACGESATSEQSGGETEDTKEMASDQGITLTPFAPSAEFPGAAIASWKFKDGRFDFTLAGDSYQLGVQTPDAPQKMCANSAKGQHIHLIVGEEPYAAKYEASFDYEIPDGEHYVLAFLSRSYHESIKTGMAHVAEKVTVSGNAFTDRQQIEGPMLFYSRPKGTYVGQAETEKVMLDFYLVNARLGDEYKVKVEINDGFTEVVDAWQPYYIEGLPMGDNTVTLTLLDASGEPADVPLNPVSRTFTLKEDPAEL